MSSKPIEEQIKEIREEVAALRGLVLKTIGVETPNGDVPSEISVSSSQPKLILEKHIGKLKLTTEDIRGRLATVYAEGMLPEKAFTTVSLYHILENRFGQKEANVHLKNALIDFVKWGYFETVQAGKRTDYRIKLSPSEAKKKGLIEETEIHV